MNKPIHIFLTTLLLLLTACQAQPTAAPTQTVFPTATTAPAEPTQPAPTVPVATATITPTPTVAIKPSATPLRSVLTAHYDPNGGAFQVDLRSGNYSGFDFREAANDLFYSDFSTRTQWPAAEWLPAGFDPQKIIELGKDPGLGVRGLHAHGITGKGISIAIIDQPLTPANHVEYDGRVKLYEKIGNPGDNSMHGPAVASIAVGKTVGVAPEATLYFFAAQIPFTQKDGVYDRDFTYLAKGVRRVVEINQSLPQAEKIRVISLSIGWAPRETAYADMVAAVEEAKAAGIFVVSSSLENTYNGFIFNGAGRDPLADPNQVSAYQPGTFWAGRINSPDMQGFLPGRILIPMDSRSYASYLGPKEYNWGRQGGWSWSIPYIAGLYALAVQVNPAITPAVFWKAVDETAVPLTAQVDGKAAPIGKLVQPVALIQALQK